MKTNQYITNYYNSYDEDSRLSPKHGTAESLTIMCYIERYVKPGSRVLEVGAETGRYSHALVRQGYMVDAVELVPHNIEIFRRHMLPAEHIAITQGNALDLSASPDNRYDVMLLSGPLHHLYNKGEKRRALGEAIRVTKQGGITLVTYVISDDYLLDERLNRGNTNATEYIKDGLLDPGTFVAKSEPEDLFESACKEDIDDLVSIFSMTRLYYAAVDGCALLIRGVIDKTSDETFKLYLKYHYIICGRKDLIGITGHAIDIFQK